MRVVAVAFYVVGGALTRSRQFYQYKAEAGPTFRKPFLSFACDAPPAAGVSPSVSPGAPGVAAGPAPTTGYEPFDLSAR